MSSGYPDFSLQSLIEQYSVVNVVDDVYILTNVDRSYTYELSGIKGLLSNFLIKIIYSDYIPDIKVVLKIDEKSLEVLTINYVDVTNILSPKNQYLKITSLDYNSREIYVELINPIIFFNSFSLLFELLTTTYPHTLLTNIKYMTASPTIIKPSV